MVKGSVFIKFVVIALLVLGFIMPAHALKDADYLKFKKESPEFAAADAALQAAWKDVRPLAKADVKKDLEHSQKQWIKNDRDVIADNYLTADKSLSPVEAYTMVTMGRAISLKLFAEQLKNPNKPVTVRGTISRGRNNVGGTWALSPDDYVAFYTLGMHFDLEDVGLRPQMEKYEEENTLVEVTGHLPFMLWFDTATLKFRPVQRP